jgi:hypothetical protein
MSRLARKRREALARFSERLADRPWVLRLARLGYAAEGLLYVVAGVTAALRLVLGLEVLSPGGPAPSRRWVTLCSCGGRSTVG